MDYDEICFISMNKCSVCSIYNISEKIKHFLQKKFHNYEIGLYMKTIKYFNCSYDWWSQFKPDGLIGVVW